MAQFEGRNLEEALELAVQSLAVERWQLTWHVLQEKRGFLGGVKHVVIDADVNQEAAPPVALAQPVSQEMSHSDERSAGVHGNTAFPAERDSGAARGSRRGRSRGRGRGGRGASPREGSRGPASESRGRSGGRGGERSRDLRVGDFEAFSGEVPAQGAESEAASAARQWCEKTLSLARLDAVVRSEENETQIVLRLYGADSARFTENNGELLDAVQVLANKTLLGRATEKDIELDSQGFKQSRIDDLEQRARTAADRVRETGREEVLPAMTPIERRIVHMTLRDDAEVTTESRGEGFFKRVAIVLRSEATGQESQAPLEP